MQPNGREAAVKALYFDNNIGKLAALQVLSKIDRFAGLGPFSPARYGEVADPRPPNGRWLKVRNKACGLCGSDVHFIFMDMDPRCYVAATPGIKRKFLGHETVGEVVELGDDCGDFRLGDRVALRIDWPSCFQMEIEPPCPQCSAGNYMLCENLGLAELPILENGGGFSPYMVLHRSQPFKVPESLSDDEAVLLEPLACAAHGVMSQLPRPNEKVLVIGSGTIGLLTVAAARALAPESEIYALARHPFQAEAAIRLGAREAIVSRDPYEALARISGGRALSGYFGNRILIGGFDVVFDSVGTDASIQDALRWARAKGRVSILGINFRPGKIDYTPIWNQELSVTGINCHANESGGESSFDLAARLLSEGRVDVAGLITHRFPMEDYREAVKTFVSKKSTKAIKIVLEH